MDAGVVRWPMPSQDEEVEGLVELIEHSVAAHEVLPSPGSTANDNSDPCGFMPKPDPWRWLWLLLAFLVPMSVTLVRIALAWV
jgi:hypothetical protein